MDMDAFPPVVNGEQYQVMQQPRKREASVLFAHLEILSKEMHGSMVRPVPFLSRYIINTRPLLTALSSFSPNDLSLMP